MNAMECGLFRANDWVLNHLAPNSPVVGAIHHRFAY